MTDTSSTVQSNFHHLIMDIGWFGLALAASSRFLSVYAIRLGASPAELGLLASMPALVLIAASALSVRWRRRYPDSIRAMFWPALGFRLSFLLPAFAPFFPEAWQPLWLIMAVTLPALPQGVSSVLFLSMMREAITNDLLTALLSRRALAMNLALGVGAVSFGLWLENVRFPVNYQIMYVFAFSATLVSLWHVNHIRLHPITTPFVEDIKHPAIPRRPWQEAKFRRVAFVTAITHIAFFSIFPMTPLFLVNELGASEGFMALFAMAELAAAASIATITRRIITRIGNIHTIVIAMFGTGLAALVIAMAPTLYVTLLGAVLLGASWTTAGISQFGFFMENTPGGDSSRYTTAYFQVLSLGMFIGPIIGSSLASSGVDLTTVMLLGAGLRLLAGLMTGYDWHLPSFVLQRGSYVR